MNRLFLVSGATGHLGTAVMKELSARREKARAFLLEGDPFACNLDEDVEKIYGDVTDIKSLEKMFCDIPEGTKVVVIHIAGIVTISSGHDSFVREVNVGGTKNIISLCEKYGVEKLVYVSSVHAIAEKPHGEVITETYDFDPDKLVGLYAKTKAKATEAVLEAAKRGLNASVVHPSGIIGPYDYLNGHTSQLIRDYCSGNLVAGVDGGYDFVDVRDVAGGVISCVEKGAVGECYILSNRYCSVREILELLHEITGRKRIKVILPWWLAKATAPLAELYYKLLKQTPLYTTYSMYTLKSNSLFSHKKADDELSYTVRDIKTTLADTYRWLLDNNLLKTDRKKGAAKGSIMKRKAAV